MGVIFIWPIEKGRPPKLLILSAFLLIKMEVFAKELNISRIHRTGYFSRLSSLYFYHQDCEGLPSPVRNYQICRRRNESEMV